MTTILLVDDDRNFLRALRTILEAEGFRVFSANNGKPALALAIRERPDIIVTDYMMPGVDGMEFCRQLKANLTTLRVPVVLLTAVFPLPDAASQAWSVLLTKPVSVRTLLDTIGFFLTRNDATVPAPTAALFGQPRPDR